MRPRLVVDEPTTPEPVAAPDPWTDRDLPASHEIPTIAAALGFPSARTEWLVAVATRREARYRAAGEVRDGAPQFGPLYADSEIQAERTFWALFESKADFPRLPWAAANGVCGVLTPGTLLIHGARTGNGKTTFLLNLTDRWAEAGRTVCYLGLEQTPRELRTKWACIRAGVPPEAALAHDETRLGRLTLAEALSRVADEIGWQQSADIRRRVRFAPTKFVTAETLRKVAVWAAGEGCQALIVDHVDRLDHGDGRNAFAEMSRTIRLAKELAVEHGLVVILASQAKRVSDKLERFMPMEASELRGGGTKEEEADVILTSYRPLAEGVTTKDLRAARQGLIPEDKITRAGIMGLKNLKSRVNDALFGRTAALAIDHGRITDILPAAGPAPVHSQHHERGVA
jgi:hypothetical protein